ncbi:MAG: HAMP domain-containing sensor histidine kinase [Peptostreptococcaceae bacterium]
MKIKDKIQIFIDEKIRFSIKSKLTLSYFVVFSIISLVSSLSLGFIVFNNSVIRDDEEVKYLFGIMIVIKLIEVLVNAIATYSISEKALLPVHQIIDEVNEISINNLEKRLDVSGINNEFKDLAKTFNNMLDKIYHGVENQKRFVSDASHELRTPISVIQGYINMLDRWGKEDKDVLAEGIDAIKDESESMKKLIETLLFLAKGEKHNFAIQKSEFNIGELIDDIIKETKIIDTTHQIYSDQNEYINIYGERNLIKEAIRVFVDNSIKYTEENGIITINSFRADKNMIITIKDNGIGMDQDELEKVFDRFYRVDKSRSKESGGFGLGLSIAKYIVDTHDGQINMDSTKNEGTTVLIKIPLLN